MLHAPATPSSLAERLLHAAQALSAAPTAEVALGTVLDVAVEALGAPLGVVLLAEERRGLRVAARRGANTEPKDEPFWANPAVTEVLRTGAPLFVAGPRAGAALPLPGEAAALGVLVLNFPEARDFSEEERGFLQALGAQGGLALTLTRSREGQARAEQQLRGLAQAALHIGAAGSLQATLEVITKQARDLIGAHQAVVSLTVGEDWAQAITSVSLSDRYAAWREYDALPDGSGIYALVCRMNAPMRLTQAELEAHPAWRGFGQQAGKHPPLRGWLAVPLVGGDGTNIGLIQLSDKEGGEFTAEDESVLVQLAQFAAGSVEKARLYETAQTELVQRQQAERELRELNASLETRVEERTRELEAARSRAEVLAALGDALQGATTPEQVAELALARLGDALGASRALVVQCSGDVIRIPVVWGEGTTPLHPVQPPGERLEDFPLLAECVRSGTAGYYAADPTAHGDPREPPARAFAVEPIRTPDGERAGLLAVWRPARDVAWPEGDRDLLRRAASTLGLALERAATTQVLQERTAALDAFVAFTEQVGGETDPHALVTRAFGVLSAVLGEVSVAYYEPEGDRWQVRAWAGNIRPDFLARMHAGFPQDAPPLAAAIQTRQAHFVQHWTPPHPACPALPYSALATYPYLEGDTPRGLLSVGSVQQRTWTERERAVIRAVGRSFGLALERARGVTQLAEEQRKLSAANEELEAFAYSVSHDLRTPVRHIRSFNHLLHKELGGHLDAKAARYLRVVDEAAARMNTLIDAMLDLSRTSRLPLHPGPLDLGLLVDSVRAELEADALGRHVEWVIAPLPLVTGDAETLRQVMVNLLGNALKYTRTREQARIEVWAEERPQEWAILVRDNGVGFDPRYGGKLFGVFQRLHRHDEFEGTGVGLANVRRIIARHGGTVFAQGAVGEGATFGFTLPR
ncbi:GAF domain-containing protein [Deinococcus sp. YIM 77859]|uniref:GAF domain-containing protein n=1 Tax=Deinococcus sp. YIM 77859 TaxID=1540221 RepID=UPI00068A7AF1|nr:GAF domain-containing protein [Deinococcus sp. YIM 77859]